MILCQSVSYPPTKVYFLTLEARLNKIFNFKYSYQNSVYKNSKTKFEVKCNDCGNVFNISANTHLTGVGCKHCSIKKSSNKKRKDTTWFLSEVFNKCEPQFLKKLDFTNTVYIDSKVKVEIKCLEHGIFNSTPNNFFKQLRCPKCSRIHQDKKRTKGLNKFIEESKSIHGDIYGYDEVIYKTNKTKVKIKCNKHGIFLKSPQNHLKDKQGCPLCSSSGFKNDKQAHLYFIKHKSAVYKIGITNRTIAERYKGENDNYEVLIDYMCMGLKAQELEQIILKKYKDFKYNGKPVFKNCKIKELFVKDLTLEINVIIKENENGNNN